MDEYLNDTRATARDLAKKGTVFHFSVLMGTNQRWKVLAQPYAIKVAQFDTQEEAAKEAERLEREGLVWDE